MSQCQQNSVMCSVCNRSWFLRFISKTKHLHKKNVLKLSILPIESVFIIEFPVGLKVKIAQNYIILIIMQYFLKFSCHRIVAIKGICRDHLQNLEFTLLLVRSN